MGDKQIWITAEAYEMLEAQAKKINETLGELATRIILDKLTA